MYTVDIIQLEFLMKMTKNRLLILMALQDNGECYPPHSASFIHNRLQSAFEYKWEYYEMKTLPSIVQIHRTLRDLWKEGLIVGTRVKEDWQTDCLPSWVVYYQLSSDVEKNWIAKECEEVCRKVKRAKFGLNFFPGMPPFDIGLPVDEVKELARKVKSLMQKTHPDKAVGFESEFKTLQEAHEWIRSGIPLPESRT